MTAVAIMGILAALAAYSMQGMSKRASLTTAANDFISAINLAKSRAVATNSNVWVLVYPNLDAVAAGGEVAGPNGAWFVYEDRDGDFAASFTSFDPAAPAVGTNDRLNGSINFIANYGKGNTVSKISFGLLTVQTLPAPFDALTCADADTDCGCSFCSGAGTGRRGAIIFRPDGSAGLVDGGGNLLPANLGRLGLRGPTTSPADFRVVVSAPTSLVRAFSK
jgi:Tfp pilus assembly protein FimT